VALKQLSDHVVRVPTYERGHRGTEPLAVAVHNPVRKPGIAAPDVLVPVEGDLQKAIRKAKTVRAKRKQPAL
jgi:hypothetical protein